MSWGSWLISRDLVKGVILVLFFIISTHNPSFLLQRIHWCVKRSCPKSLFSPYRISVHDTALGTLCFDFILRWFECSGSMFGDWEIVVLNRQIHLFLSSILGYFVRQVCPPPHLKGTKLFCVDIFIAGWDIFAWLQYPLFGIRLLAGIILGRFDAIHRLFSRVTYIYQFLTVWLTCKSSETQPVSKLRLVTIAFLLVVYDWQFVLYASQDII